MASRRSLGGGRVLGNGKSLAPPTSQPAAIPGASRTPAYDPGLLSPSESSVSLSSHTSSTPLSIDHEDISARAALEEHASRQAAVSASSRMVCPICNEVMMTLLQLNRHIDDNHAHLEEVEQDEVKTWFEQQMKKAKKFQPLAVLNQKLKGLEVFEANDTPAQMAHGRTSSYDTRGISPSPSPAPPPKDTVIDPDEVVTKSHWQRTTGRDACAEPSCKLPLGPANGQVNCRHCGKLFCEEHTMYQMKLSRSAQHEPVRGMWCRVCETCYKCRPGYNDHTGFERSHMEYFKSARRRTVDKQYLEISRLEKRLTRLTQLLADPPPEPPQSTGSMLWSTFAGAKTQQKALEQSVVTWEDDSSVTECPFCQQAFSQYTFRRHHCRMCGRVVCGDPTTSCSTEVGLDVDTKKPAGKVAVDVRMCKDCQRTIFSKADFARELATPTADQRAYNNLLQFEQGIRLLLPKFQRLLVSLQDPEKPPIPAQLADATKVRKRLMDAFTQYDVAARRIRDLPTSSPTQERLQKAIYTQATNFLHIHMLPLKSLPKILRHATPNGRLPAAPSPKATADTTLGGSKPQPASLAQIKKSTLDPSSAQQRPSLDSSRNSSTSSSAALTALESEEKELRERLIVLEEQKFFVSEMIADANKRRKFDEVGSLAVNLQDLEREIDQLQGRLADMDFAGAWRAGEAG
ncbi:hypothetical protein MBLNU230_g4998t1 [Neophaeotheca triangularis]